MSCSLNTTKNSKTTKLFSKLKILITILLMILLGHLLIRSQFSKFFSNYKINTNKSNIVRNETEIPFRTRMKMLLNCEDKILKSEILPYGRYWLLKNYIIGYKSMTMGCGESITFTTHGDYTYIKNLPGLVERWRAPISFALIAANSDDYYATMDSIAYVLNCLPESQLIRDYVTFHIYLPRRQLPSIIAKTEQEILQWPYNCKTKKPPYENVNYLERFRDIQNLSYPINIGRNIARQSANTHFIFACDLELYPNYDLVKNFLQMVEENPKIILAGNKPKIFVIPAFEVANNNSIPNTKLELREMFHNNTANIFHHKYCNYCHGIPQNEKWLEIENSIKLEIFQTTKRHGSYGRWEPFYISDNKEPLFDQRITWRGELDRRIQNYAMCLQDYDYNILHPAFLVYVPGIKTFDMTTEVFNIRFKNWVYMRFIITSLVTRGYKVLYGSNEKCEL